MGELLNNLKNKIKALLPYQVGQLLSNKKNVIGLLVLGILVLAIPLGVNLLKYQQIVKSRATNPPIVFTGDNVKQMASGQWAVIDATKAISLELTSPLGPPGSPSASVSPTPTPVTHSVPYNLSYTCGNVSGDDALVTFSWSPNDTGVTPYGYTNRVNAIQDVWSPAECSDNSTSLCPDTGCDSGDIIGGPAGTKTSYTVMLVSGDTYGWAVQTIPNSGSFDRRHNAGSFKCDASGNVNQISPPDANADDQPRDPTVRCSSVSSSMVKAVFSWGAPVAGAAPTGYIVRVNNSKDVWCPVEPPDCDPGLTVCHGVNESYDYVKSVIGVASMQTYVKKGLTYALSIQTFDNAAAPNKSEKAFGPSFACQ